MDPSWKPYKRQAVTGHRWTNRVSGAFPVIGDWRSPNITLIIGYPALITLYRGFL